ncbi:MAG: SGNH/GDSL hydrolase family protein [Lentisphaerae bacterium]|nr:SGNH/GDSL hydrolase family protein [Lentisphaerota bacterium]
MIGMNDCTNISIEEFKTNLNALADKFAELGTLLIVQTTCPIIKNTAPDREPHFPKFMDALREFAAEKNLPLIDHEAIWRDKPGLVLNWMSNAFHPNGYGHLAFAHKIFKDMDIWDDKASTCRMFTP